MFRDKPHNSSFIKTLLYKKNNWKQDAITKFDFTKKEEKKRRMNW